MPLVRAHVALAAYRNPRETRSDSELVVDLLGDLMHLADALKTHDEPDDPLGALWPQDPDGTRHGLMATQLAAENYHFEVIGDGDYPVDDRGYRLATTAGDLMQLASRFRDHEAVWCARYPEGTGRLVTDADHERYAAARLDLYETLVDLGHQIVRALLGPDEER